LKSAVFREVVSWANAGGHDDALNAQRFTAGEMKQKVAAIGLNAFCVPLREDMKILLLHEAAEASPCLRREMSREGREAPFHDPCLNAELVEGAGGFESEEPAANHRRAAPARHMRANLLQVLSRSIGKDAMQIVPGQGWYERPGSGGENQFIIGNFLSGRGAHDSASAVHKDRGIARVKFDVMVPVPTRGSEQE
jgi:hypothetical protein